VDLFTDGAARGNPGPAGGGIVLVDGGKTEERHFFFGKKTNNQSEYLALIEGLKLAVSKKPACLNVYMDSELIVKQVQGKYKVKSRELVPLNSEVRSLLVRIPEWKIVHIPREKNKRADYLSNLAIDSV
jgi:ribonuclease HI